MIVIFVTLAAASFWLASTLTRAAEQSELESYQQALAFVHGLSNQPEGIFDDVGQRALDNAATRLQLSTSYWGVAGGANATLTFLTRRDSSQTIGILRRLLDGNGSMERIWLRGGSEETRKTISRHAPFGNGVVLLRIGRTDVPSAELPAFAQVQADLAENTEPILGIPVNQTTYAAVFFVNAPTGTKHTILHIRSSGTELGSADLATEVPPTGTLAVTIVDAATGKPTPAAAAVFTADNELVTPGEAIAFDEGGFHYGAGRVRPNEEAHYWPGTAGLRRAFFIDHEFSVRVPGGSYRVIASKGPEYMPVTETVPMHPGAKVAKRITLRRWVDMPAKGWYSGDGHVHYARKDEAANRRVMLWAQAEDIHVANVLRMGDANETYFEQYGFGKGGRFLAGDYALVPGQEDPRTNVIGHTLHMNLQGPARAPEQYYLYGRVFDEVHRQGGLSGYAHVQQQPGFFVRRDMSLNIPQNKVDFAEICEFGDIGEDLYYEFLNLGFPITASAGSDVPWGNTIGTSRVYAYTGLRFDVDEWYAAIRAGHTFVSTGAMLEFTVNGKLPGSEIDARPGDVLTVKASAYGKAVPPGYLEIVSQGDVIRSVRAQPGRNEPLTAEFTVPVRGSMWIGARCRGGHTTPVYVKVNGRRFWREDQVKTLIARRMEHLREIDELTARQISSVHQGNWDNPDALKRCAVDLHERVRAKRAVYEKLLEEAGR